MRDAMTQWTKWREVGIGNYNHCLVFLSHGITLSGHSELRRLEMLQNG